MKKFIFASMAAGLVLASCSNEEFDVKPAGQDGTVTFTASLPVSVASRLYSDGQTAKNLQYAVYLAGEQTPLIEGTAVFTNLKATVSTTLATGKSYDILFWAQAEGAPYAFDAKTQDVTVTYDGITANNESLDAFFFAEKELAVNGPVNKTVTLTRPFAQLNIGTNDIELAKKAGLEVTKSAVSVTAYETLNLYSGEVSNETAAPVVFGEAAIPTTPEVFPVAGYDYLAMAYILVPADKQTIDVTLSHDGSANAPVFAGVPVQRNYRTNIYGALLTDPAIFNVEINPDYETPDHEYAVVPWDGKTITLPEIDEEAKTVAVNGAAEFQGLAQLVNGANGEPARDFEGFTITLSNDVDFGGHEVTPIADGSKRTGSASIGNAFKGVIDGGGHTVSNFTIKDDTKDANSGFIANLKGEGAELRNINFSDFVLEAPECEQVGVVAMVTSGAKVTNVKVLSGSISGKQGVGAIVGRLMKDGTVDGCSNAASVSATTNNVGGIVGAAYYTQVGKTMVISNCENSGKVFANNVSAGGIAGLSAADVINCVNTGDVAANNNSAGGIVGQQLARGVLSGCVNRGNVSGNASNSVGFGGIIGWLKYDNSTSASYPNHSVIEIRDCENYGEISAPNGYGVAGIVGMTYRNGVIDGCGNYSKKIVASGMAAGITVYQNLGTQLPDSTPLLTVSDCTSTTNVETQMTAGLKGEIVYDNTAGANTSFDNNKYLPE